MSSEQFSLLFYACMLIDAIGWFGFVALPRIRKLLSCKVKSASRGCARGHPLFYKTENTFKTRRFCSFCSPVIFREACCWHGMNRNPEYDESCNCKM